MSNLVPLYVDKETGREVASERFINSIPIGGAYGYLHNQPTAATTWTINHNGGTLRTICQIYDSSFNLVLSDQIAIVNINTIQVTFTVPQDGFAHVIMFKTL